MRMHNHMATEANRQAGLGPLMALSLMVVVPMLIVAMTRVTGPLPQFLIGLAIVLLLVAIGAHAYRLGKPA